MTPGSKKLTADQRETLAKIARLDQAHAFLAEQLHQMRQIEHAALRDNHPPIVQQARDLHVGLHRLKYEVATRRNHLQQEIDDV